MELNFNPENVESQASWETPGILYALAHDKEQNLLYGAGTDWTVFRVDLNAEEPVAEPQWTSHENYVSALQLLDEFVITAGYDRQLHWTHRETGKLARSVEAHAGWVRDLALTADGQHLVSAGDDMLVKVWDARSGELRQTLRGHATVSPQGYATALYSVAASPDGTLIAAGDRVGHVCVWERESGRLIQQFDAPELYTYDAKARVRSIGGIRSLAFSPDQSLLAVGGIGQVSNVDGFVGPCRVELWNWRQAKRSAVCTDGHKAVLNHIAFHPSEPILVAAGGGDGGGLLAFWKLSETKLLHKAKPKGHLQAFVTSGENQLYAAGHAGFQAWTI